MDKAIEDYTLFRDECPKCNSRNIEEEMHDILPDEDAIFLFRCLDCDHTFEVRRIAVIVSK